MNIHSYSHLKTAHYSPTLTINENKSIWPFGQDCGNRVKISCYLISLISMLCSRELRFTFLKILISFLFSSFDVNKLFNHSFAKNGYICNNCYVVRFVRFNMVSYFMPCWLWCYNFFSRTFWKISRLVITFEIF